MAIDRNQVQTPTLPTEAADVPAIGGEVIVRGMLLTDRMALWGTAQPREGETEDQAKARAERAIVPDTLAICVVLDDGVPLWTSQQWDAFGAANPNEALRLFAIANRLSGGNAKATEKN